LKSPSLVLLATASVLTAAACGATSPTSKSGVTFAGKIDIGSNFELSGAFQSYAQPYADGLRLAASDINAAGGVTIGSAHYSLNIVEMDTQTDPTIAATNAISLVQQGIKWIFGPLSGASFASALAVQSKAEVASFETVAAQDKPLLSKAPEAANMVKIQELAARYYSNWFKGLPAMVPGATSLAMAYENDVSGQAIRNIVEADLPVQAPGIKLFPPIPYVTGTADLSTVVTQLKADHPSMILFCCNPADYGNAGRAVDTLQAAPYFLELGLDGMSTYSQIKTSIGTDPNFTLVAGLPGLPAGPGTPGARATFPARAAALTGRANVSGEYLGMLAYDFLHLLAKAMTKADTDSNVSAVLSALREVQNVGLEGTTTVTSQGFVAHSSALESIKNGVVTEVILPPLPLSFLG
jgi:ABC-type branched-subunit amino acid transport system substrate-binding protein